MTSAGGVGAQPPRNHLGWTLGRASGSPGMDTSQEGWRSSAWLQQLQCSLLHAPPASACSRTCLWPRRSPRRVAVDMMELLALSHRRDGAASPKCCQLCSDVEWMQPPTSWDQWWTPPTAWCGWRRLYVSGIWLDRSSFYHFTDEYTGDLFIPLRAWLPHEAVVACGAEVVELGRTVYVIELGAGTRAGSA